LTMVATGSYSLELTGGAEIRRVQILVTR
jgi:hypothetical protein